ncbi:MAG: helix-turn-helix domain-containing protein [Deltaproteobacteria bacterium]|nr:helix-turn-helix domain-containing protein [Deltaproteobacteria bacterium]
MPNLNLIFDGSKVRLSDRPPEPPPESSSLAMLLRLIAEAPIPAPEPRKPLPPHRPFTEEEFERLVSLWENGADSKQIQTALGRSAATVNRYLCGCTDNGSLMIPIKRSLEWVPVRKALNPKDRAKARKMSEAGATLMEIITKLKITPFACRAYGVCQASSGRAGFSLMRPSVIREEFEEMVRLFERGDSYYQIGAKCGRSYSTVRNYLCGFPQKLLSENHHWKRRLEWTPVKKPFNAKDRAMALQMRKEGASFLEIVEKLKITSVMCRSYLSGLEP